MNRKGLSAGIQERRPVDGRFPPLRAWREICRRFLATPPDPHSLVPDAPTMSLSDIVRRFWLDARPLRWWVLVSILLASLLSAITIVEISLFKFVVDDVLVPARLEPLLWIGPAYIVLAVLSGLLSGLSSYLSTWINHTFLVGLRTRVFSHLLSLPQEVHDRRRLGDSMTRITSDAASVESFMIETVRSGVSTLVTAIFYLVALFVLDARLAAASLIAVPLFWLISYRFSRLIKRSAREQRRRGGSLSALTEEHLGNAALVQSFNREADAISKFHRENLGIRAASLTATRIRGLLSPIVDVAELVGVMTVIVLGTQAWLQDG